MSQDLRPGQLVDVASGRFTLEARRPDFADQLLLYPVNDDPDVEPAECTEAWAEEHALRQRFYITGVRWFRDVTGSNTDAIARVRKKAVELAKRSEWTTLRNTPKHIAREIRKQFHAISIQQFYNVTAGRPVFFPKACLFILACEIVLQEMIDEQNELSDEELAAQEAEDEEVVVPAEILTGQEVYRHMRINGACWNINGLNLNFIKDKLNVDPSLMEGLPEATYQTDFEVFYQHARGHTLTYPTARAIRDFSRNEESGFDGLGRLRSTAGRKILGTENAASHEVWLRELPPA